MRAYKIKDEQWLFKVRIPAELSVRFRSNRVSAQFELDGRRADRREPVLLHVAESPAQDLDSHSLLHWTNFIWNAEESRLQRVRRGILFGKFCYLFLSYAYRNLYSYTVFHTISSINKKH